MNITNTATNGRRVSAAGGNAGNGAATSLTALETSGRSDAASVEESCTLYDRERCNAMNAANVKADARRVEQPKNTNAKSKL